MELSGKGVNGELKKEILFGEVDQRRRRSSRVVWTRIGEGKSFRPEFGGTEREKTEIFDLKVDYKVRRDL